MAAISRRSFLARAGTAAGMALASPAVLRAQRGPARVRLGFVGLGESGVALARLARASSGAEIAAVADLYEGRLLRARELAGDKVEASRDVRRVLDRKDVDAVVIATPNHSHVPLALLALAAGKDVYCEWPLTHGPSEAASLRAAVQSSKRAFVSGGGRALMPLYAKAKELVQSGRLGRVTLVQGRWSTSSALDAWLTPIPPDASSESVDFRVFESAARGAGAFDAERFFRWPRYWDYGSGLAGARFAPQLGAVQWLLNLGAPDKVTATGALLRWKDGREVPDTMSAVFEYEDGLVASLTANQTGGRSQQLRLIGTDATLVIEERRLALLPEPAVEPYSAVGETWPKEYRDWLYMMHGLTPDGQPRSAPAAFPSAEVFEAPEGAAVAQAPITELVDVVRTRREPREALELGLSAAQAAHMANESYRQGRSVTR